MQKNDDESEDEERGNQQVSNDAIDPFGENPGWDPSWVKAYKINFLGKVYIKSSQNSSKRKLIQVLNLIVFGIFNIVFWGVALSHYYAE